MNLEKFFLKHGSINYKYLMKYPEVIEKVDSISKKILDASPSLKKEFNNYIENSSKIVKLTVTTDEKTLNKVKKDAEKDLLKQIGNKVLNVERDIINKEKLEEFEKIRYENNLIQGISDLISLFSQLNQSYNYNMSNNHISKDMTREEKIETHKRLQDKGSIEW
ncbi:MAG: hypothetical protein IKF97_06810 [Clostridia bacterium]|nr:hypothetical protein [Clostridia bacterium]